MNRPSLTSSVSPVVSIGIFAALFAVASTLAFPATAAADVSVFEILINRDQNTTTGCDVTTVDGLFEGVEHILTTTVETDGPSSGSVTGVERRECTGAIFGPPIPVDAGGWDVGVGLGEGGSDVIETYFPLSAFASPTPMAIRLGVASMDEDMDEDALLTTNGTPTAGPPIVLVLARENVLEIPTASEWGLLLLAVLLLLSAMVLLRHRGARGGIASLLALVLLVGSAGVLWAGTLDGNPTEWNAGDLLGEDAAFDAPEGADIVALFGQVDGNRICFRIDAHLQFPPDNMAPTAVDDAYATDEDTALAVPAPGVLTNDSDPDSDPLTVTDHDPTSAQGAVVNVNADGSFSYDPTAVATLQALDDGESMDDTFTYTISDGIVTDTATVTVTVSGVNDAPTAMDDSYETDEDTPLVISAPGVLVNDDDVDTSDSLTAVLDTTTANGSLTLNPDGSFTYTPNADFNGVDSFTYRASDGTTTSNLATATITVGPVNDGPNAVDDSFMTDEDTVLSEMAPGVLTNDTDPEMDPISVISYDGTSAEGATLNVNADGSFTYDPTGAASLQALDDGEMVADTFTYTIDDGSGAPDSATVTITVTGANDAPVAADDAYTTDEDTALNVPAPGVLGNDTDVDVETLTAVLVSGPSNAASFTLNADGSFGYTPAANFNGSDSFTYRASDGTVTSNVATVTITVDAVNDLPVADDETVAAVCNVESVVEMGDQTAEPAGAIFRTVADNVLAGDGDPVEGGAISIVSATGMATDSTGPEYTVTTTQGGTVTLHPDGSFSYTPEGGDRGVADSFQYTIQDTDGGQATATVTLNVGSTCVWFVDNSHNGGADDTGTGTTSDPFTSLVDEDGPDDMLADDAEDATLDGDIVYVFEGNSNGMDPYAGGYVTEANETILGEGVDLIVDLGSGPETLFDSVTNIRPTVAGGAEPGFTTTDGSDIEIAGFSVSSDVAAFSVNETAAGTTRYDLHDNFFVAGTVGLDATATGGSLEISVDDNTDIVADGAAALSFNATGGTITITSLCGNTVHGDTAGIGILAAGVEFDADPATGAFDEVECTAGTVIGSMANRIGGGGVVLQSVTGDLDLGPLSAFVGTAGGLDEPALQVTGSGVFNAGAGTGFQLTTDSGTLDSADGPALSIDGASLENVVLTALASQNSGTQGVNLVNVPSGSFQVTGSTTVGTAGGDGVAITDSTVGVTFTGQLAISGTGGEGVSLDDLVGNFSAADTTSSITGTTGDAFNSLSGEGNVTYNGTITNTANNSVDIRNHGGVGAATTIAFGGDIDDDGAGIFLDNNDQGMGTTVNFTGGLDLDTGVNEAFVATSGGTVNVTSGGVSTTADTTTGTLVRMINTTIGASGIFFDSTSKTGGADGILLTNVGSGSFTTDAGTIANQTSRGVDVSGGSGNITVDASLSTTSTGRSVEVTTHTGGTVDFNGAIDDNGIGVRLENNVGAILRFDGGMDIDTAASSGTEEGFQATGGGTLHVTGTNTVDTSAATGIAVNIANTTIGSDDVTFQTVSANGAANGISLDTTGTTGLFSVTGGGGTCTVATPTCTGGRIQNTNGVDGASGGNGIYLNNTGAVSLSFVRIDDHPNHAIFGDTVRGFSLIDSLVDGANGTNDALDEGSIRFQDLLVNGALTRVDVSGGHEDNLRVVNETGTLDRLVISNSSFHDNSNAVGNDGMLFESRSSAVMNVTVDNTSFSAHRGDHFDANATDSSSMDVVFSNNSMTGGHPSPLGQTFILSNGASADVTFSVTSNTIEDAILSAFTFFQSAATTASSSLVGTFSGNDIGVTGDAGSGSTQGHGSVINAAGSGTVTMLVDGNEIRQWSNEHGILVQAGDGSPVVNVTVTNNTIKEPNTASFPTNGLHLNAGTTAAGAATVCLDVQGNDITNSGAFGADDFRLRQRNNSTVNLPGYGGGSGDTAAVVTFVQGNNTGTPAGSASVSGSGGGFTGVGASCTTP